MTGVSLFARTAVALAALAVAIPTLPSGPSPADAMPITIEGYGASTRGGDGAPECVVRSLGDRGPGTLRECLSRGNRHVMFAVAGIIELDSQLGVQGPFVTIDGFSAPSPGITLRGWGLDIRNVNDVIVSGLRIRDAGGGYSGKSSTDCLLIFGPGAFNIVIDHVSIYNCADGGLDISSGPKNITVQWSIISAVKLALWGSTSSSSSSDTDGISVHHTMFVCGPEAISRGIGCDRAPLVRASGTRLSLDLRHNVIEGWIRANGTKIEPAAEVNVVGNAYIPRPESTFAQRQDSIAVNPGTRVYTANNIELGASPRPNLNDNGNESRPFSAPPIVGRALGCVVRDAGMHPRDAADRSLLPYVTRVPAACDDDPSLPSAPPPPPPTQLPDLVPRALSAPSSAAAGQALSLGVTVANAGTATAPGSTARLYLSTDRIVSAGDVALGSIAVPALAPAATHAGSASVTLPAGTPAGAYHLLVQADGGGAITESSETNNTLAMALTVTAASASPFAVMVDAESMTVASGMTVGSDPGALGGRYLSPSGGSNSTRPVREASASVTVPRAGTYYLWARMYGPSAAADALYLGIGSTWFRAYPSAHQTYQWVRIGSAAGFALASGVHAIQVGRGEVGARLDAVYLTSTTSDVPTFAPPSGATIPMLLEAESMVATSGMSVGSDAGALGGQYLSPTGGANSTTPRREASVSVTIPTAGTYYLWARMFGLSGAADALYVGVGSSWDRVYPTVHGTYQWVRVESANGSGAFGFSLAPGTHVIQVGRGEVNTRLDALYVTNTASDVPRFGPTTAWSQALR